MPRARRPAPRSAPHPAECSGNARGSCLRVRAHRAPARRNPVSLTQQTAASARHCVAAASQMPVAPRLSPQRRPDMEPCPYPRLLAPGGKKRRPGAQGMEPCPYPRPLLGCACGGASARLAGMDPCPYPRPLLAFCRLLSTPPPTRARILDGKPAPPRRQRRAAAALGSCILPAVSRRTRPGCQRRCRAALGSRIPHAAFSLSPSPPLLSPAPACSRGRYAMNMYT